MILYIFFYKNGSPNAINIVKSEENTIIYNAATFTLSPVNDGFISYPKSRVSSIATTNGDYFKKCAPIVTCNPNDKYRTFNGSCNNLQNPNWGAALTPFYRLMNADFNDGNKR